MTGNEVVSAPGMIALVGSGEYTAAMTEADTFLLSTVESAANACVALLPTASGQEPGMPARWNAMGQQHFAALGVRDIRMVPLTDRAAAGDEQVVAQLEGATLYYFSGGDPAYLIECLRDTPAWAVIVSQYERGAVLAGCSAGAMALGAQVISLRSIRDGGSPERRPALGIVPNVICFPHFDRLSRFVDEQRFQAVLETTLDESIGLGLDEDTALVRLPTATHAVGGSRWRVVGRQTVAVFARDRTPHILHSGDEIEL